MTEQAPPTAIPPAPIPAPPSDAGHDRFLLAIVGGTVLLVVVSAVLVLTFGRSRPAEPADPTSPAGVVQGYVEAVRAGDVDKARSYLTSEARVDFDNRNRTSPIRRSADDHIRIVVETVAMSDTTAEVKVTISRFYARTDPFSSGTSHYDVPSRLVREGGTWKISQPPQAYDLS